MTFLYVIPHCDGDNGPCSSHCKQASALFPICAPFWESSKRVSLTRKALEGVSFASPTIISGKVAMRPVPPPRRHRNRDGGLVVGELEDDLPAAGGRHHVRLTE